MEVEENDKQRERETVRARVIEREEETQRARDEGEDARGTDELDDAAPVVESPCHREQPASVSRGLLLLRCVVVVVG